MDVPKLYSFKQLYNISTLINDKSTQQDDINSIKSEIIKIHQTSKKHEEKDKIIDTEIKIIQKHFTKEIQDLIEEQNKKNRDFTKKFKKQKETNAEQEEKNYEFERNLTRLKDALHTEHASIGKQRNLLEGYKVDITAEFRTVTDDFKERLETLDNYYTDNFEQFETSIEAIKTASKNADSKKEVEMMALVDKQIAKMADFMSTSIKDI